MYTGRSLESWATSLHQPPIEALVPLLPEAALSLCVEGCGKGSPRRGG